MKNLDEDYFGRIASLINSSKQTGKATCCREKCTTGFQKLTETNHTTHNYSNSLLLHGFTHLEMHFPILSLGEVCLFMKTERERVLNSFEKF